MAFLSFIPCGKAAFSTAYYSRFLLKKSIGTSIDKARVSRSRVYGNNVKYPFFKKNLKSVPICFSNHKVYDTKIRLNAKQSSLKLEYRRCFHTSASELMLFYVVCWEVFGLVLKFLAIVTGRVFGKWWRDLPLNKEYFLENIAFFVLVSIMLSILIYYVNHIEETPITKRKRFMAFNPKQLEQINPFEFQQIMQEMQILPANHPYTFRVNAVLKRILDANQDIKEMKSKKWHVTVINMSIENAFVFPIGCVFVDTRMLSLCSNDDQLATVLSHEIAHCIQDHVADSLSCAHLFDLVSILIIAGIWAIIPCDITSLLTHWVYEKAMKILLELPYSRKIETEADTVGLQLAAKACFDVRESSAFWAKMAILHRTTSDVPQIEFLSTHPNHEKRSEHLDSIMDQAICIRQECGCPKLKQQDPRFSIKIPITKALEAARRKYLQ